MIKLLSSAALGVSVIVALTTAPIHAENTGLVISMSNYEPGFNYHAQSPQSKRSFKKAHVLPNGFFAPKAQRNTTYTTSRESFAIGPTQKPFNRNWELR